MVRDLLFVQQLFVQTATLIDINNTQLREKSLSNVKIFLHNISQQHFPHILKSSKSHISYLVLLSESSKSGKIGNFRKSSSVDELLVKFFVFIGLNLIVFQSLLYLYPLSMLEILPCTIHVNLEMV